MPIWEAPEADDTIHLSVCQFLHILHYVTLNVLNIQDTKMKNKMWVLLDWSILWWTLCNGELIDIINYADRDMANAFNISASTSQYM